MSRKLRIPDVHPNTPCCANCFLGKVRARTRGKKFYCAEALLFKPQWAPQNEPYAHAMLSADGERLTNPLSRKRKCHAFVSMSG